MYHKKNIIHYYNNDTLAVEFGNKINKNNIHIPALQRLVFKSS